MTFPAVRFVVGPLGGPAVSRPAADRYMQLVTWARRRWPGGEWTHGNGTAGPVVRVERLAWARYIVGGAS